MFKYDKSKQEFQATQEFKYKRENYKKVEKTKVRHLNSRYKINILMLKASVLSYEFKYDRKDNTLKHRQVYIINQETRNYQE